MDSLCCPHCGNEKNLSYVNIEGTIWRCMSCGKPFDSIATYPRRFNGN